MKKLHTFLPFLALTLIVGFSTHAMGLVLDIDVMLKGAYDANDGMMRDDLRTQNLLPLQEPYTALGYTIDNPYAVQPSVYAVSGSDAIVDFIIVELRSKADPTQIITSQVALVQRDGGVANFGGGTLQITSIPNDQYYVAIHHRNHLSVMSLRPVDGTSGVLNFDFTDLNNQIFASDEHAGVVEFDGKRMMNTGDVNGDGQIKYTGTDNDRDPILIQANECLMTPGQNPRSTDGEQNRKKTEQSDLLSKKGERSTKKLSRENIKEGKLQNEKDTQEDDAKNNDEGSYVPTAICHDTYHRADVNLDGKVQYTGVGNDRDVVLAAIGGVVPTNVVVGELPELQNDTTLPTDPIPGIASILSPTSVQVDWSPSSDTTFGLAGYIVLRDGVEIAYIQAPATTFVDNTVTQGPTYYYDVYALDYGLNESALSAQDDTATGVAPTANDDVLPNVTEGQSVSFNLFANDDVQGGSMQAPNPNPSVGDFNPVNTTTGDITFNAYAGSAGTHTFSYTIQNGLGASTADITVTIDPAVVNQPPTAVADTLNVEQDTQTQFFSNELLDNDTDPDFPNETLLITQYTSQINLTVTPFGSNFIVTPDPGFVGTAYFNYHIQDSAGNTDNETVTVIVHSVQGNQAPVAGNDIVSTPIDTAIDISDVSILSTDDDPDGDPLEIVSVGQPANGSVTTFGNPIHTIGYTPNNGYVGTDSFTYTISDGSLTDTATVYVDVQDHVQVSQGCSTSMPTLPNYVSTKAAVSLCANVQSAPAEITLYWSNVSGLNRNSISIYRRAMGASSWGSAIAYPNASGNHYTDTSVAVGTLYEYKVQMSTSQGNAYGYIASGINVPASDFKGKIILVVDNTFQNSLSTEIETLEDDYQASGWIPETIYVNRSDAATTVKDQIMTLHAQDTNNTKAVFLLGHVPVAYSGAMNPDGHGDHYSAWAGDGYYGDMNYSWSLGGASTWSYSHGANSDSKFDHTTFPSDVELQVGRVDMYNLPAFYQSEEQLLRDYLERLHTYKAGLFVPQQKAYIMDNFEYTNKPFSRSAYSAISPAVDPNNITVSNYGTPFISVTNNDSHLWGYASGGGWIDSADGVGTTADLSNTNMSSVFNMVYGSYFGDWDTPNNFMRSFLADSEGLTNIWSGKYQFYAHHMAMGGNIGESWRQSANNSDSNYYPKFYQGGSSYGETFFTLHGDPALELHYPVRPGSVSVNGNNISWGAANDPEVIGYHVYQITNDSIERINGSLISGTSTTVSSSGTFMVRAVRIKVTPSGSYHNLSMGRFFTK